MNQTKRVLLENFHIVLWLIKDTCWMTHFKLLGTIMVAPTLFFAYFLAYKTYKSKLHFVPNLAICAWISANSLWMLGEFFEFNFHSICFIFFLLGILLMGLYFYYLFLRSRASRNSRI